MQFRNGYLGVCLVVVAVVLTILGSYALSMDVEERNVTKYAGVAELTGLFDSEQAPAYINYNPSTNYTGYYTDPDNKYFDGVTATTTTQPNQYRLNLEPTNHSTGTTGTISGSSFDSDNTSLWIKYLPNDLEDSPFGEYGLRIAYNASSNLTTVLSNLNINSAINRIELRSIADQDALDGLTSDVNTKVNVNWVIFTLKNQWEDNPGQQPTIGGVITKTYYNWVKDNNKDSNLLKVNGRTVGFPCLSCIVDLTKSTATLYYDNDLKELVGIYSLDDVIITYGGGDTDRSTIKLGTTALYDYSTIANPEYMDIRDGVKLEESA